MWKRRKARVLTRERLSDYEFFLREQEKAGNTVKKYMQSLASLRSHLAGAPITKAALIEWKEELVREYAPASVNAMIAAVNFELYGVDGLPHPASEDTESNLSQRGKGVDKE